MSLYLSIKFKSWKENISITYDIAVEIIRLDMELGKRRKKE